MSAWIARLPALRDALALSPGRLGTMLLAMALGGLASMSVASAVALRLGQRRAVRLTGILFAAAYLLLGLASAVPSVPLAVAGLFLHGVAFAGGNLVLNVGSTIVERAVGRPILPQFHAAFSIGTVVGSLFGAAAAAADVPLLAQLLVLAVLAPAWRWPASRRLLSGAADIGPRASEATLAPTVSGADARGDPHPGSLAAAWREPRTLLIGVVILAAMIAEGGAMNWLALATVDGLAAAESFAAVVLGLFVGAMTAVRLVGSSVIGRLGRVRTLRTGAAVALAGVVLFMSAPNLPLACVGAVAWGAGCALNFPIAVSAASDDPGRAAHRVAVMSAFAAAAAFVEPAGLGALAEQVGIRAALLAVAAVLVVILVVGGRTAPLRPPVPGRGAPAVPT